MKTTSIPPNSGPDSLWRQAERAVEEEDAGTPPFAERVALEIMRNVVNRGMVYTHNGPVLGLHEIEKEWAKIIDREIREATGCG